MHWPPAQLSALWLSHAAHAAPPVPQYDSDPLLHVVPSQQPVAHDVASHTHVPFTHRWPAAQEGLPPHMHWPPAQLSALWASHAAHAAPPVPQYDSDPLLHVVPSQHPVAHDVASHTHVPLTHRWPAAQEDPVPHWQVPLEQLSPAAHELDPQQYPPTQYVLSHWLPSAHSCPLGRLQTPVWQDSRGPHDDVVQHQPPTQ